MFVLEDMIGLAPDSVDFVASLWLLSFALGDVSNWVTARNPHFLKKKKKKKLIKVPFFVQLPVCYGKVRIL